MPSPTEGRALVFNEHAAYLEPVRILVETEDSFHGAVLRLVAERERLGWYEWNEYADMEARRIQSLRDGALAWAFLQARSETEGGPETIRLEVPDAA